MKYMKKVIGKCMFCGRHCSGLKGDWGGDTWIAVGATYVVS